MKKLHGADVTDRLKNYRDNPGIFYPIVYKPIAVAVFFFKRTINISLILSHNKTLSASNMDVYDIRLGDIAGISVGYLIHSPLNMKVDLYHAMFYRRSLSPTSLIESQAKIHKRLIAKNLVFHGNESLHYLAVRKVEHPIVNFISGAN
jgi:hypothetical protein